jgi:decaprenylphospho-beta-D-erythro-pentofuranosid-2-ulose 2-reductase
LLKEYLGAEKLRVLVIGATSEIAQSCCRVWANQGPHQFVFVGRDEERVSSVIKDFQIRFPNSDFKGELVDHLDPVAISRFTEAQSSQTIDLVFIAHGSLTSQSRAYSNLPYLWEELQINALSPIAFVEGLVAVLENQGRGMLAVIGSVAGDRGRAINYGYGAAKAALETYISGLQHRLSKSKLQVTLVKPGPTRTPMTAEAHVGPARLADPARVATQIVAGIAKGRRVVYAPRIWRYFMLIIKFLPFWLFKRINF